MGSSVATIGKSNSSLSLFVFFFLIFFIISSSSVCVHHAPVLLPSCRFSRTISEATLVIQNNGGHQMSITTVTDMRKLNDLIEKDVCPLPLIDDVLGQLGNAKYYSVLDHWSGFYQVGLSKLSLTNFSANGKKYQYKRKPMGLCNAPAWFSRMMTKVLGSEIDKSCMLYMDDVISLCILVLTGNHDSLSKNKRFFSPNLPFMNLSKSAFFAELFMESITAF